METGKTTGRGHSKAERLAPDGATLSETPDLNAPDSPFRSGYGKAAEEVAKKLGKSTRWAGPNRPAPAGTVRGGGVSVA